MRTKLFFITLLPMVFLFIAIPRVFEEPDDISNMPFSSIPEFKIFTEIDSRKTYNPHSMPKNDYNRLINIDFKFKTLPHICGNNHTFLLILVHSAPGNFNKRRTIRETWGRGSERTKLVFLLGSVNMESYGHETIKKIKEEQNAFDDLVIGSFIDAYKNLTYKHVMAFKYALYHCKEATYILKTDDDVFVNIPDLVRYIMSNVSPYGAEKLLMCNVWRGANVARSHRSRYRISIKQYPYKTFPAYCSGWFILYSPDVVFDLYSLAQSSEYFWIDDVFITGILTEKSKISHFNIKNIVVSKRRMDEISSGGCYDPDDKFILGRPNINTDVIRRLWECSILNNKDAHA